MGKSGLCQSAFVPAGGLSMPLTVAGSARRVPGSSVGKRVKTERRVSRLSAAKPQKTGLEMDDQVLPCVCPRTDSRARTRYCASVTANDAGLRNAYPCDEAAASTDLDAGRPVTSRVGRLRSAHPGEPGRPGQPGTGMPPMSRAPALRMHTHMARFVSRFGVIALSRICRPDARLSALAG